MMNREIKFRTWIPKGSGYNWILTNKEEGYCYELVETYDFEVVNFDNEKVIWEQFTGLKDINGKDIYEGDIIHSSDENGTWEVEFIDGSFQAYNRINSTRHLEKSLTNPDVACFRPLETEILCEVIGNIHEGIND